MEDYIPYGEAPFVPALIMDDDGVGREQVTLLTKLEPAVISDSDGNFMTMGLRVTLKDGTRKQFVIPPAWVFALSEAVDTMIELFEENEVEPIWDARVDLAVMASALAHRAQREPEVRRQMEEDLATQPEWLQDMVREALGDL